MKTVLCTILLATVAFAYTGCDKKKDVKTDDAKKPATEQAAPAAPAAEEKK